VKLLKKAIFFFFSNLKGLQRGTYLVVAVSEEHDCEFPSLKIHEYDGKISRDFRLE